MHDLDPGRVSKQSKDSFFTRGLFRPQTARNRFIVPTVATMATIGLSTAAGIAASEFDTPTTAANFAASGDPVNVKHNPLPPTIEPYIDKSRQQMGIRVNIGRRNIGGIQIETP